MKIICDSGAFGAFKSGIKLDVKKYIPFVKKHQRHIEHCVNLDVIPSEPGRDVEAQESYDNIQRMWDADLTPIPVFHQGDKWKWLHKYLEHGETYIGLSTDKKAPQPQQVAWLDDCFELIGPNVRTHLFGSTSPLLVHRYPWKSADSGTWLALAQYGEVAIPLYTNGKPDYTLPHSRLVMTERRRFLVRNHVEAVPEVIRDRARHYFQEYVGIDFTQARYSQVYRWKAAVAFFKGHEAHARQSRPGFEIAFVTNLDPDQAELLSGSRRLLSYFDLKNREDAFERYMEGDFRTRTRRKKPDEDIDGDKPRPKYNKAIWSDDKYRRTRAMALYNRVKEYRCMTV